jgi:hypothetical protein
MLGNKGLETFVLFFFFFGELGMLNMHLVSLELKTSVSVPIGKGVNLS